MGPAGGGPGLGQDPQDHRVVRDRPPLAHPGVAPGASIARADAALVPEDHLAVNARRDRLKPVLTARADRLATTREAVGCFVRLTHVPQGGAFAQSAGDVLKADQAPQGVAPHVGCLKDPVIVNRRFLNTPERSDA